MLILFKSDDQFMANKRHLKMPALKEGERVGDKSSHFLYTRLCGIEAVFFHSKATSSRATREGKAYLTPNRYRLFVENKLCGVCRRWKVTTR